MKRMGEPLKQGRPMHVSWHGFDKVYNSLGRVSAKCHICLEVLANTGRLRLESHRTYCQELHNGGGRKRLKRETAELDEGTTWIENPNSDWTGFRQSELPNAANMYYAQCKTCLCILEALTGDMEAHKANCNPCRTRLSDIVLQEDAPASESDVVTIIEEDEEEAVQEYVHYTVDLQPVTKKPAERIFTPKVEIINARTSTDTSPSVVVEEASPSSESCCSCGKPRMSSFDEAARVWAQKLNDLPLEQALSIEKKMSDMLFEAMITDLQTKKALQKKGTH